MAARPDKSGTDPEAPGVFTLFVIFWRGRRRALRGGARPARTWCTIPRKPLFLRFLCTKSESLFGARPAETWCTNPRKTLFLRFLCTKSGCLFGERPAETWCTIPRKPLLFRRRAPRLWDQRRRRRAGRGASLPANPCSFVDGHHVFGAKGAAGISSHQYKSTEGKN